MSLALFEFVVLLLNVGNSWGQMETFVCTGISVGIVPCFFTDSILFPEGIASCVFKKYK